MSYSVYNYFNDVIAGCADYDELIKKIAANDSERKFSIIRDIMACGETDWIEGLIDFLLSSMGGGCDLVELKIKETDCSITKSYST